jgi:carbon-monoxide dehydrogenase large subunit/6-hydroxypseudooxynicotine dehydrogenase subunit gamma
MLHMRIVRSAHAHGRIRAIAGDAARGLPGVAAVWTSADVCDVPPIDFRLTRVEGLSPYRQPILARERVRYVGEPVAAVFATDPYVAEDVADLVELDIEGAPRRLMRAPRRAARARAFNGARGRRVLRRLGQRLLTRMPLSSSICNRAPRGARDAARSRATPGPRCARSCGAAKVPHWNRDALPHAGAQPTVHLYEGHVGGGFGIRGEPLEDVLVLRRWARRPVKWIETGAST